MTKKITKGPCFNAVTQRTYDRLTVIAGADDLGRASLAYEAIGRLCVMWTPGTSQATFKSIVPELLNMMQRLFPAGDDGIPKGL